MSLNVVKIAVYYTLQATVAGDRQSGYKLSTMTEAIY